MNRLKPEFRLELITPDNLSFDFHNPPERAIWGMSGWGMSPSERAVLRGPFQQGSTVLSQRLDEREIRFTLRHNGCSKSDKFGNRTTYVEYLRENRRSLFSPEPSQLIWHYIEDGAYKSRALDVFFEDGFVFTPPQRGVWDEFSIQEEVIFLAHDPIIYDPTINTSTVTSFSTELTLPVTFPFVLGGRIASTTITNSGTWETYPVITVTGPVKNFSIENLSTNKRIDFADTVVGGNDVIFDLTYGTKTITDECGSDRAAGASGDIGTFSLQCAPQVTSGQNSIKIYAESYSPGTTQFKFEYYTRYRGI